MGSQEVGSGQDISRDGKEAKRGGAAYRSERDGREGGHDSEELGTEKHDFELCNWTCGVEISLNDGSLVG